MKYAQTSFAGGEVSEWGLSARYDISKYRSCCRTLQNFIVELHGGARRRPGTHFMEDLGGMAVLIPFEFSTDPDQTYALVFQDKKIRIAQGDGFVLDGSVPVEIVSPYAEEDLFNLDYVQSGDTVYLAHPDYTFRKLVRSSHTSWTLVEVSFNPSLSSPTNVVPDCSLGGSYPLRYVVTAEDEDGKISLGSDPGTDTLGTHPSDWQTGDYCNITWTGVTGAVRYYVYREEGGYYGLIGTTTETSFKDIKYDADTSDTPREAWNPFTDGNNPALVTFHNQRLVMAEGLYPQKFCASRVGDFENLSKSRPLQDDDPIEFQVASGRIDAIQWLCSFQTLLLGTGGAEYKAAGSDSGVITATDVMVTAQSYWGSKRLRPLIIGNSVLHVQRQGSTVRDLSYSLEVDGYKGNDLSVLAPHLFSGHTITQWAYQQSPHSVVWSVRDDGVMLGLTYLREHEIWAWFRFVTDGEVQSVCSVSGEMEDTVYLVVKRTINGTSKYYLERLATKWHAVDGIESAMFLDSALTYSGTAADEISGLEHLEGRTVDALADGSPVRSLTVTNGSVTLPFEAETVHVGLPYTSLLRPMVPEGESKQGSTLGDNRAYGRCRVRIWESVGGEYGVDPDNLSEFASIPATYGDPVEPMSGDVDFAPGGSLESTASVYVGQSLPLPMTVVALMLEVDLES